MIPVSSCSFKKMPRFGAEKSPKSGFTLVELSMVLLIIGLIAGGILVGRALIRQAALFSMTRDITKFQTAHYTFYSKYNAYPGDMTNATQFWGFAGTESTIMGRPNCTDPLDNYSGNLNAASVTNYTGNNVLTCNGNGDGIVGHIPQGGGEGFFGPGDLRWQSESFRYWQHLANAELISGEFTGVPHRDGETNTGFRDARVNINIPGSSTLGGGFLLQYPEFGGLCVGGEQYSGDDSDSKYQMMMFGREASRAGPPFGEIITPVEANGMDRKIDDGKPGTGSLRAFCVDNGFPNADNPSTDIDSPFECVSGRRPSTATYRADDEHIACHVRFILR